MVLEVERRDSVAVVTISAEAARNAFDSDSMNEISTTLNGLMDDSDIRGIVLTGTGRFFCAGADIDEFQRSIDDGRIGPLVDNLTSILHPLQIRMRLATVWFHYDLDETIDPNLRPIVPHCQPTHPVGLPCPRLLYPEPLNLSRFHH